MEIKSVKYNLIMNMILKMSQFLFPLITFPYVSRILLANGNGKIAFATSVASYFTMLASLGIPTYGIKICAQHRDNREELSRITQEIFIINGITSILAYTVFFIMITNVQRFHNDKILFMICSTQIILTAIGAEWFYQAIEQYDYITVRNIAFKLVSIVLMFIFVHNPKDYVVYGAITIIGTCGSNIMNLIRIHQYITLKPIGNYNIKRHIKPILVLFLLSVSITVYTNLDTVMLGFFKTDVDVGFYNAATKTKGILVGIVTALGTVLLPRISYYIEKNMLREFKDSIRKSFQFVWMLALPISIFFVIESKVAIQLLAGNGYSGAVLPMQIITPTILLIGLSNITGIQILIPIGKEKYTVTSTVIGAIVDLALNTIFIPKYGASGAALGTLVAEGAVLLVQYHYVKEVIAGAIDIRDGLKTMGSVVIATVAMLVVKAFTIKYAVIEILVVFAIFSFVYLVCLLVTKEAIVTEVVERIKDKLIK